MANFVVSGTTLIGQTLGVGDVGIVGADGLIATDGMAGVALTGINGDGSALLTVMGQVLTTNSLAVLSQGINLQLVVGADGALISSSGGGGSALAMLAANWGSRVDNLGLIQSHSYGVYFSGMTDSSVHSQIMLTNSGTILGGVAAVTLDSGHEGAIFNSGTISSAVVGIFSLANEVRIENTGEIRGITAIQCGPGTDTLVNRGTIWGEVWLGEGTDLLDNRWGRIEGNVHLDAGNDTFDGRWGIVTGTVAGGAGDDTLRGNAGMDEVFDGGDGTGDTLGFRPGPAVTVALDGSVENAGAAAGDVYANFEHVNGSGYADRITGDGAANRLSGGGGVDTLQGGAGNDTLIGNAGADVLSGGLGNDQFRFNSLAETGDKISDFGAGIGNDDRIVIDTAGFGGGFGGGEVLSTMYRARADNVAQDADDRFILRTGDKTLWFDADGSGAEAAVLVADLQDTAVFTRLDILLI